MCDIARDWLKRAQKSEDPYDRFISAYIALNFLYGGRIEYPERERMASCLAELCDANNVNISPDVYKAYTGKPVKDECPTYRFHKSKVQHVHQESWPVEEGNYESLFKAIYQVRCNLFHGNKSLGDERDRQLVKQGAEVLIAILSTGLGCD